MAPPAPMADHGPMATERALGVETEIVSERGQWAVDIIVFFADGVVRRRISTYRTEALAKISASYIKRAAERDIPGPLNG
jgi:hypothetical protein